MELPNPDPTELSARPEHGGRDRHMYVQTIRQFQNLRHTLCQLATFALLSWKEARLEQTANGLARKSKLTSYTYTGTPRSCSSSRSSENERNDRSGGGELIGRLYLPMSQKSAHSFTCNTY
eukprot:1191555-Prorocentrum_minimum.AAC.1